MHAEDGRLAKSVKQAAHSKATTLSYRLVDYSITRKAHKTVMGKFSKFRT